MTDTLDPLVLDLVEWVARAPRPYSEVIEAWRTSCPRLTVWEEAVDRGLVVRKSVERRGTMITTTGLGRQLLREHGRLPAVCCGSVTGHQTPKS